MSQDLQPTRIPRAFDPDAGHDAVAPLTDLKEDWRDVIIGAGGSSPYLKSLIGKHAAWLPRALAAPDPAMTALLSELQDVDASDMASALRLAKGRIALLTGLLDLGGVWDLEKVTLVLSNFADHACQNALRASLYPLVNRNKIPGLALDDLENAGGIVVLGMGKLGAQELNYSSDIDIICLFDQDRFDAGDFQDARAGFIKATRGMSKMLNDVTAEGYVFRTDLRLRPDPSVTPVCLSMDAAERYYESVGRTWERAAYIKARTIAGDVDAGQRFLSTLTPFVWRKHLDFAAIEDAHNMRLAIKSHKGLAGAIEPRGHNIKLGRGGIREIEFFTQTRQLIAGGRDLMLRCRGTVVGLGRLATSGWIAPEIATSLTDHYRFHRTLEHRVQMLQDAQTHTVPKSDAEFERVACLMGQDATVLRAEILERLQSVERQIESFFSPSDRASQAAPSVAHLSETVVAKWLSYPALRTDRAQTLFDRLRPHFEDRLAQALRPEEAVNALDGFLLRLPAGVQLLSLFESNPQLIDLLLDIVTTAPALAEYLSRNAQVLDAVIGGRFFEPWPGQAALEDDLQTRLDDFAKDYEGQLDTTRRWMKEWHFRIGVHVLRGLVSAQQAGQQYTDLARAVLARIWHCVQLEFSRKHGPAPGRGAVLLGMGALGGGRMNALSDLDLIVIYDPKDEDASCGPRPLATRPYFARLTQALITAVSAPMSEGRLYEVDMRLRPSGNQGPVATSWAGFQNYQRSEAWTWEHLAMTRAHVIAGSVELAHDVERFVLNLLSEPRDTAKIASDVIAMRARIAEAKPAEGALDIKSGPGLMQDIELFAQTSALIYADGTLTFADSLGAITDAAPDLLASHTLYWKIQTVARLLSHSVLDDASLAPGAKDFLLRLTDHVSLDDLQKTLSQMQTSADTVITKTLTDYADGKRNHG